MVKTLQNTFCHFSVLLKQFSRCEIRLLRYPVEVEDGVVDEGAVEQLADADGLQLGVEHLAEGEADPERGLELELETMVNFTLRDRGVNACLA